MNRQSKWKKVDGDIDYQIVERVINAKLNKRWYKWFQRYCRKNTSTYSCHHEWDCCGCISSQYVAFRYSTKYNQVVITVQTNFNY